MDARLPDLRDAAGRPLRARRLRIGPNLPARRAEVDVGRDAWDHWNFIIGRIRHAAGNPDGTILNATGPRVDPHRRYGRVGEWECWNWPVSPPRFRDSP